MSIFLTFLNESENERYYKFLVIVRLVFFTIEFLTVSLKSYEMQAVVGLKHLALDYIVNIQFGNIEYKFT